MKFLKDIDTHDVVLFVGIGLLAIGCGGFWGNVFLGILVVGLMLTFLGVVGLFRE